MKTLQLDESFLGETFILKLAVKAAIQKYKEDIEYAKKALKEDPANAHVYKNAIRQTTHHALEPILDLYNRKIKKL